MKKPLLALLLLCLPLLGAAARPNILVFLVDDMGVMDTSVPFLTGADGKPEAHPLNKFYRTPNMERLAQRGIRFEQFYANSVCSPTRVTLMTGQSSARHHTTQWIKPESNNAGPFGPRNWQWKGITRKHRTLPAILRTGGYRTIHAGKAHFGPNNSFGELPQNFGFDVNIAGRAIGAPGSYYGTDDFGHAKKGRAGRAVNGLKKYHGKDIFLTEALTIEMKAEIKRAVDDKKPFFSYMSYYAVHGPFMSDKRFAADYAAADVPAKAKAFATMIAAMDKSVGDILDHLDNLGVAENTFVIFLGDNGSDAPLGPTHKVACAAPLRGKKGTHYEGGMRVPFIAAWAKPDPGNDHQKKLPIRAGTHSRRVGTIHDIFPTLLMVAGLTHDGVMDGADLSPLLAGGTLKREATFLMHFPHSHRSSYFTSYRKGDWKLVYHYHKPAGQRCELFNLAADRDESDNLAGPEPAQLKRMIGAMARALEEAGAQYVVSKQDPKKVLKPELP